MSTERSLTPEGKSIPSQNLEYTGEEKGVSLEYSEYLRLDEHFSGDSKKKLLRKVDFRVLLALTVSENFSSTRYREKTRTDKVSILGYLSRRIRRPNQHWFVSACSTTHERTS